jgi:hypothetical protein
MRPAALGLVPLAFLLFGCGDDGDAAPATVPAAVTDAGDESPAAPAEDGADLAGGGTGLVVTDEGDYSFAATTCVQYEDEIEVGGPGTAPDGTPVFVTMSAGEGYANLRIDLGVDDEFTSSDDILISGDLEHDASGSVITGSASLRDGSGGPDSVDATFEIDCG